jgi:tetratricopeptide (TPR) repeat protein
LGETAPVVLAAALGLINPSAIIAETYLDSATAECLVRVQQLIYNDRFVAAESLATVLIETSPDEPAGYLCKAIVLVSRMFAWEENSDAELFHALLDSVESKVNRGDTLSSATCAWRHLFKGHAKAYRSVWESHFGSFLKAIKLGRQAKAEYEKGLACDSTLYDLYFGLGLYHYWKSAKAGLFRSLGLFVDERELGIRELQLAADSSLFSREAARSAFAWIQLDRKEYDAVISISRQMAEMYPEGTSFLWPMAKAYWQKKDYQNAAKVFTRLRERFAEKPGNYFNLIECDYYLYFCYEKLSRKDDAKCIARAVVKYYRQIPAETRKRQRTKLSFLKRAARS